MQARIETRKMRIDTESADRSRSAPRRGKPSLSSRDKQGAIRRAECYHARCSEADEEIMTWLHRV